MPRSRPITASRRKSDEDPAPGTATEGMPLVIVANLSTEQAVAAFEMIDDLPQQIFHQ